MARKYEIEVYGQVAECRHWRHDELVVDVIFTDADGLAVAVERAKAWCRQNGELASIIANDLAKDRLGSDCENILK